MKKILMTLAMVFVVLGASAQVYVGGGVGIGSSKVGNGDAVTSYKLLPEVGYNLSENWAVGAVFGWEGAEGEHTFSVNPYARYTFLHSKFVNLFCDGTVGYGHNNAGSGTDLYQIGLKPGLSINLNEKFSFVTHLGFFGYSQAESNGIKAKEWGGKVDGSNVTFGFYYNF